MWHQSALERFAIGFSLSIIYQSHYTKVIQVKYCKQIQRTQCRLHQYMQKRRMFGKNSQDLHSMQSSTEWPKLTRASQLNQASTTLATHINWTPGSEQDSHHESIYRPCFFKVPNRHKCSKRWLTPFLCSTKFHHSSVMAKSPPTPPFVLKVVSNFDNFNLDKTSTSVSVCVSVTRRKRFLGNY